MEVEALRAAVLIAAGDAPAGESAYGRSHRDTAYLAHNAVGPTSGTQKLIECFYPSEAHQDSGALSGRRSWRECVMLRRLGFSPDEIRAYQIEAARAETFS